jgi:hypothetical protein
MSDDPSSPRMMAPPTGVKIRMYRQGLGDCFLLAFAGTSPNNPVYVVIDSGAILGTPDPKPKMSRVAQSLHEATGGFIHLLIVTHEHWDHVSGFSQADEIWKTFTIERAWMAWTENPDDALGQSLKKDFGNDVEALRLAVQQAEQCNEGEALARVKTLLGMFGEPPLAAAGDNFSRRTHVALEAAREYAGKDRVEYRYPGEVRDLEGTEDVRFYVLGPPRSRELLTDVNPSTAHPETYTEKDAPAAPQPLALSEKAAFTLALRSALAAGTEGKQMRCTPLTEEEKVLHDLCFPFDWNLRIPQNEAHKSPFYPFFVEHYGFTGSPPKDSSLPANGPDWRRIETAWLGVADELALQMDSYTNNTSLALAIELPKSKKVLLFPADAQVGNWISWDSIPKWTTVDGTEVQAAAADLLARTVFYKVGHHGSHNATMKDRGLERMGPDLVAFVPVDTRIAHEVKHWNEMPFLPLMARLREKTRGRVACIDDPQKPTVKPEGVAPEVWQAFVENLVEGPPAEEFEKNRPLYYEYRVEDV